MGILDQALALSDEPPYIKMVLHGAEGVGKTTFAANAPEPAFVDFERSTDTLRHDPSFAKIKVFRPKVWKDVFDFTKAAVGTFETVIYDTATSMQIFYMREYMVNEEKKNPTKRDKYLPYQGDYRYATNELTDFFLFLQEAPINVIFNAHSNFVTDPETNALLAIRPALTPAVWGNLRAFISVVAYMEKKPKGIGASAGVERRLYLNSTSIISAKNRLGIQEQYITDPNFKELFNT